jgi:hypothetical protein
MSVFPSQNFFAVYKQITYRPKRLQIWTVTRTQYIFKLRRKAAPQIPYTHGVL